MTGSSADLFSLPSTQIDFEAVRTFILQQEESAGLTESVVLELKRSRSRKNVVEAVAALSNTDGGLVLLGVAEDAVGEDRLVGVPRGEHDALVNQLRLDLSSDAMPEIVAVAVPGQEAKLILVLRVDADRVRHPVVVNGRVLVRVPGQSVAANRDQVEALVDRDRVPTSDVQLSTFVAPTDPMRFPFWPADSQPSLAFRMVGGLALPPRAANRPWLDSAAKDAAIESLQQGPVPDGLDTAQVRPHELAHSRWQITEVRSDWCQFAADTIRNPMPSLRHSYRAAAYLYREPRQLGLLLGVGVDPSKSARSGPWLSIEDVFELLLAGMVTIAEVCRSVSSASGIAEPASVAPMQGWLELSAGSLTDALLLYQWERHGARDLSSYWFRPGAPVAPGFEGFAELARTWLTMLLLDCGAHGFEAHVSKIQVPKWPGAH